MSCVFAMVFICVLDSMRYSVTICDFWLLQCNNMVHSPKEEPIDKYYILFCQSSLLGNVVVWWLLPSPSFQQSPRLAASTAQALEGGKGRCAALLAALSLVTRGLGAMGDLGE